MTHSAGDDPQGDSGEDVSVVALAGMECAPVSQSHLLKGAPTGKDALALFKHHTSQYTNSLKLTAR